MKTFATLLFAAITSFASLVQSSDSHPNSLVQVRVVRVDLQQVTSDYIRFAMVMRIKSSHSARLRRIRFSEMRWGSLPFFLSPIEEKVHLTPGEDLILPPIPVTFYFRDLDTLQPLEDSLRNQEITVSGRARAELDLSPLERIALLQWSGQFEIPVQSSFPLTVPGGQLGRTAAIASVRASELALALGGSALNLVRTEQMDRADEVNRLYRSALVVAEYRYAVMLRDGQRIDFKGKSLGFLLKPNKVLLTAETVEPWKYDSDVASLLESKQARLVSEARDLILTLPQDEAEAPSIGNNQLQIERLQIREEKVLTVADNHRGSVRLAVRRTNANYALIRLNQPSSNRLEALPSSKETMDNLDRVAIFHFTGNGKLELIFVPCAYKDGRLNFDAPVDNTAFGSPVIGPKGILGMVQEELSGMPVSEISN